MEFCVKQIVLFLLKVYLREEILNIAYTSHTFKTCFSFLFIYDLKLFAKIS